MFCDESDDDDEFDTMNDMSENPNMNSDQKGFSVGNETVPDVDYKPKVRSSKNMPPGSTRTNKLPGSIITNQIGMNNPNMGMMPANNRVSITKSPINALSSPKDF
jgi:hypothetical protein